MADYYDTLGVARGASEKDIRSAFRKLARKHHPDVNDSDPASEEKFKEINEAYTVLSDADSRRKYDRYGDDWKRAGDFERRLRAIGLRWRPRVLSFQYGGCSPYDWTWSGYQHRRPVRRHGRL